MHTLGLSLPAVAAVYLLTANVAFGQDPETTVLSKTAHVHSENEGVCAFASLSNETQPIAVFGLFKRADESSRFGYLILFEKAKEDSGKKRPIKIEKLVTGTTSETSTKISVDMKWNDNALKVGWNYVASKVGAGDLIVSGKPFTGPKPRVFVARHQKGKLTVTPIAVDLPAAPDVTENSDWNEVVLKAIKKLKASEKFQALFEKSQPEDN